MDLRDIYESQVDEVNTSISIPSQLISSVNNRQWEEQRSQCFEETDRNIPDIRLEKLERLFNAFEEVLNDFDEARQYTTSHDELDTSRSVLTAPAKIFESDPRSAHNRSQSDNHNDLHRPVRKTHGITANKFVSRTHDGQGLTRADPGSHIIHDEDMVQYQIPDDERVRLKQNRPFLKFQDMLYGYLRAEDRKQQIIENHRTPSSFKNMGISPLQSKNAMMKCDVTEKPHIFPPVYRTTGNVPIADDAKVNVRMMPPPANRNTEVLSPATDFSSVAHNPTDRPGAVHRTPQMFQKTYGRPETSYIAQRLPEVPQTVLRSPELLQTFHETTNMAPSGYRSTEEPLIAFKKTELCPSAATGSSMSSVMVQRPEAFPNCNRFENSFPNSAEIETTQFGLDKLMNSKIPKSFDGSSNPEKFVVYTVVKSTPRDIEVENLIRDETGKSSGMDGGNDDVKASQYDSFRTLKTCNTFERQPFLNEEPPNHLYSKPSRDQNSDKKEPSSPEMSQPERYSVQGPPKSRIPDGRDGITTEDGKHFDKMNCPEKQSVSFSKTQKPCWSRENKSAAGKERANNDKHYVHSKFVDSSPDKALHKKSSHRRHCRDDKCRRDRCCADGRRSKSVACLSHPQNVFELNIHEYTVCCGSDTVVANNPYSKSTRFQTKSASHLDQIYNCPVCHLDAACCRLERCQPHRFEERLDCTSPCCVLCNSVFLSNDLISKVHR